AYRLRPPPASPSPPGESRCPRSASRRLSSFTLSGERFVAQPVSVGAGRGSKPVGPWRGNVRSEQRSQRSEGLGDQSELLRRHSALLRQESHALRQESDALRQEIELLRRESMALPPKRC